MEVDTCTFITIVSTVNFIHNQRVTIVTRLISNYSFELERVTMVTRSKMMTIISHIY